MITGVCQSVWVMHLSYVHLYCSMQDAAMQVCACYLTKLLTLQMLWHPVDVCKRSKRCMVIPVSLGKLHRNDVANPLAHRLNSRDFVKH